MTNKEYAIMILEKLKGECSHIANIQCEYDRTAYKCKSSDEILALGDICHAVTLEDIDVMINKLMEVK